MPVKKILQVFIDFYISWWTRTVFHTSTATFNEDQQYLVIHTLEYVLLSLAFYLSTFTLNGGTAL